MAYKRKLQLGDLVCLKNNDPCKDNKIVTIDFVSFQGKYFCYLNEDKRSVQVDFSEIHGVMKK